MSSPAQPPAPSPAHASPDGEGAVSAPTLVVRPATDADGPAVARVIADCFAEYEGCFYAAEEFPELERLASAYAERGGAAWVADVDGIAVGSVAVFRTREPGVFEVTKVYLAAGCRGRGTAAEMLGHAVALAAARGARRVRLWTDTRFRTAHRFYEKSGFRRLSGERYLPDVSSSWEYLYVLDLSPPAGDGTGNCGGASMRTPVAVPAAGADPVGHAPIGARGR